MSSAKIMIVEDDFLVARDIQSTLKGLGYGVSGIASSGKQAINKALDSNPDLILMDIVIKGDMDGISTAEKIKTRMDVPVVYLSSHSDASIIERAKVTEPGGFVPKPFNENMLKTTIEMALHNHKVTTKLKNVEQRYRELYDDAPDGYISIDSLGIITEVNKTFTKILGYSKNSLIDKDIMSIVDKNEKKSFRQMFSQLSKVGSFVNFESHIVRNNGEIFPALINGSAVFDSNGNFASAKIIIRDVSDLSKRDKKVLSTDTVKFKKKMPLTENEKRVLYGILRYPSFNDIELAELFKIKRSTITAIKNKLRKEGYYYSYRIPNFAKLGCELCTILYAKLNGINKNIENRQVILEEIADVPEQVYVATSKSDLIGLCVSKNLTEFKRHMDKITRTYREYELLEDTKFFHYPFEISVFKSLNDSTGFINKLIGTNELDRSLKVGTNGNNVKALTSKERTILYTLVKFSDLNDSEISKKTKLPRTSVSQTRRKLVRDGFLENVNIPNSILIGHELLVLSHIRYNPMLTDNEIKKANNYIKKSNNSIFAVACDTEGSMLNIYNDYSDYSTRKEEEEKFFSDNNLLIEEPENHIISLPQMNFQKLDFAPLVKKILNIKIDY